MRRKHEFASYNVKSVVAKVGGDDRVKHVKKKPQGYGTPNQHLTVRRTVSLVKNSSWISIYFLYLDTMKNLEFSIHTSVEERKQIKEYYRNSSVKKKENKPKSKKKTVKLIKENYKKAKIYSKELVNRATKAEKMLMKRFDEDGMIYDFQHAYYSHDFCYIVDFWFKSVHGKPICIELDGSQHKKEKNLLYDKKRTYTLMQKRGIYMLRFNNYEVYKNIDRVVDQIYSFRPMFIDDMFYNTKNSTQKTCKQAKSYLYL